MREGAVSFASSCLNYCSLSLSLSLEKSAPLHQFVSPILHFIERIYRDENKTEELARAAAGLIGDLAKSCGKPISSIFQSNRVWLSQFFSDFSRSTSQETKQTIQWAQSMVRGVTSL